MGQTRSRPSNILYEAGLSAFRSKAYREAIDYLTRATKAKLNQFDQTNADRLIGISYSQLGKERAARASFRKATASGLISGVSVYLLALSEQKRSRIYKWVAGERHSKKLGELYDWIVAANPSLVEKELIEYIALTAFQNKQWRQAATLYDDLIVNEPENLQYLSLRAMARFKLGDLYRAHWEIENIYKNFHPDKSLLPVRGELNYIFGHFREAKLYYSNVENKGSKDRDILIDTLDICAKAADISETFSGETTVLLFRRYEFGALLENITNLSNFDLILRAVSTHFDIFHQEYQDEFRPILKQAQEQHDFLVSQHQNIKLQKYGKHDLPASIPSTIEDYALYQKRMLDDINRFDEEISITLLDSNLEVLKYLTGQLMITKLQLRLRVVGNRLLLKLFRFIVFFIPTAILLDGFFAAVFHKNLVDILVLEPSGLTFSPGIKIVIGLSWLFLLFFADEIIEDKITNGLIGKLRKELKSYIDLTIHSLVAERGVQILTQASQPLPSRFSETNELIQFGLDTKKVWELRRAALGIASTKASANEIEPYKNELVTMLGSTDLSMRFIVARVLALNKNEKAIPVLENALRDKDDQFHSLSLQSLAIIGNPTTLTIIKDFAIANIDTPIIRIQVANLLKDWPSGDAIPAIVELIHRCITNGIATHDFYDALGNFKGQKAAELLLQIFDGIFEELKVNDLTEQINKLVDSSLGKLRADNFDDFFNNLQNSIASSSQATNTGQAADLAGAILNTESEFASDEIKKRLLKLDDINFNIFMMDFVLGKNFSIIRDIAFDNQADVKKRMLAVKNIALFEKDSIQELVFQLWKNRDDSELYEILGDIGSAISAEFLGNVIHTQDVKNGIQVIGFDVIHAYESIALCGDAGRAKLDEIIEISESSDIEKMYAMASLIGVGLGSNNLEENIKKYFLDPTISDNTRKQSLDIIFGCVSRKRNNLLYTTGNMANTPSAVYSLFTWLINNTNISQSIRSNAEEYTISLQAFEGEENRIEPLSSTGKSIITKLLARLHHSLSTAPS